MKNAAASRCVHAFSIEKHTHDNPISHVHRKYGLKHDKNGPKHATQSKFMCNCFTWLCTSHSHRLHLIFFSYNYFIFLLPMQNHSVIQWSQHSMYSAFSVFSQTICFITSCPMKRLWNLRQKCGCLFNRWKWIKFKFLTTDEYSSNFPECVLVSAPQLCVRNNKLILHGLNFETMRMRKRHTFVARYIYSVRMKMVKNSVSIAFAFCEKGFASTPHPLDPNSHANKQRLNVISWTFSMRAEENFSISINSPTK